MTHDRARRLVVLLAALTALVVAGCAGVSTTPGPHTLGAQNRVGAFNIPALTIVVPAASQSSCSRPGFTASTIGTASGFCVATEGGSEGFSSFSAAKRALGSPGEGNVYDHVVEQSQIGRSGFSPEQIHNPDNLNPVPAEVNQLNANYYSTKQPFSYPGTVRDWLTGQSFEDQFSFGQNVTQQIENGEIP